MVKNFKAFMENKNNFLKNEFKLCLKNKKQIPIMKLKD